MKASERVSIIGAGPAGLTAAYELSKHGVTGSILEFDSVVGGIARTVERDGYRFDIGGHRFFTKVAEIERLWNEMLGQPMLTRPRLSRIFYRGKFYDYPLKAANALKNMGVVNASACVLSYMKARIRPIARPDNFQEWVTNQFGARLFNMFFKSYTEKVWGCPCTQIGADWAAQRIKGLSLGKAIRNSLFGEKGMGSIRTLIDEFKYPPLGPGQLWEACAEKLMGNGWRIELKTRVTGIEVADGVVVGVRAQRDDGQTISCDVQELLSSMPLRELLLSIKPSPPTEVLDAAANLAYRDFLTVALVLDKPDLFPDNWIYVHSPEVRVGRIQNFGNWSQHMLADSNTSCLGLEYFVFKDDDLWASTDEKLVEMAYAELQKIGLAGGRLIKGYVVRMPKAYPVYDPGYKERLSVIRNWLSENVTNLHCIGRNGQHRYNNQDHSMATALIAARNIALSQDRDPWAVNDDAEYHEIAKTDREAPVTPRAPETNETKSRLCR